MSSSSPFKSPLLTIVNNLARLLSFSLRPSRTVCSWQWMDSSNTRRFSKEMATHHLSPSLPTALRRILHVLLVVRFVGAKQLNQALVGFIATMSREETTPTLSSFAAAAL